MVFNDFTDCQRLDTDPDIEVHKGILLRDGRHSWYNGYYHKEPFQERVRYSFPDDETIIDKRLDKLHVGNFCQFASGTTFMLGGNHGHNKEALTPNAFNYLSNASFLWEPAGDIIVGHDVWTGYESLIMSGVTIGNGAIIGARAMVTKDVPPYAIVVETNKVVGYRFDEEERARMERIAWWSWNDERINEALPFLQGKDLKSLEKFARIELQ